LSEALREADELRYRDGLPDISVGMRDVLGRLSVVRGRLDQIDTLLTEVGRFRTGVRVLFKEASGRVDDKWAERVAGTKQRPGFGGGDIEGPRERYAKADVHVLGDRIVARQRERLMDAVNDAYTEVDRIRRSLESVRGDLHVLLRLFTAPEHRLDRTDVA
jgi:hypothetical protein